METYSVNRYTNSGFILQDLLVIKTSSKPHFFNIVPQHLMEIRMADDITIYINPKCTKCRLSMELLEENDIDANVIEYLDTPPDASTLSDILDLLKLEPRELMRKFEEPYKTLNLDNADLSRDELIKAMVENPILIERPIVINGNKATIGRPPEKILDIL